MRIILKGYLLTKTVASADLSLSFSKLSRWVKVPFLRPERYCTRSFHINKIYSELNDECPFLLPTSRTVPHRCLQTLTNCLWTNKPEREEESVESHIVDSGLDSDPEVRKWLEEIRKDFENEDKTKRNDIAETHILSAPTNLSDDDDAIAPSLKKKYTIFRDEESTEILDEQEKDNQQEVFSIYTERKDEFAGLNLKRGVEGVFDIEELIDILHKENLQDICTIGVAPELHYCDYLVIVSAISERQVVATGEFMRKLYKKKKNDNDPQLTIEGRQCRNWQALDMGNIVLHIFMPEERCKYDLETLWSVGSKYDDLTQQPVSEILLELEKHSTLFTLDDMRPLEQRT